MAAAGPCSELAGFGPGLSQLLVPLEAPAFRHPCSPAESVSSASPSSFGTVDTEGHCTSAGSSTGSIPGPQMTLRDSQAASHCQEPTNSRAAMPSEAARFYCTGSLQEAFAVGEELGRGHLGVVRVCVDRSTGKKYACKSISHCSIKTVHDARELEAETLTMFLLQQQLPPRHQTGLVRLHKVFRSDRATHLVLDLCPEGDLFSLIQRRKHLPEAEAAHVLRQLVLAVQRMHSCHVVHRDLKPENVLVAGWEKSHPVVKVADFGLSMLLGAGARACGVAGSPFYMAPELVRGQAYGKEVDVWSLGVILYTCLAGWLPFWGKTRQDVFSAVCRAAPTFTRRPWPGVSTQAKQLVQSMLCENPKKRISLSAILQHPWIRRHCDSLLVNQTSSAFAPDSLCGRAKDGNKGFVICRAFPRTNQADTDKEVGSSGRFTICRSS